MVLHFVRATGVFFRTLPFVALRIVVGGLLGLITVVYFGVVGWLVLTLLEAGTVSGPIGGIGLLIATVIFLAAMRFARRYVLYMVAAGHIAIIAHIVDTGETPSNQLAFGTRQVKSHFAEANALFVVDQLVKSVLRQFNRRVISLSNMLSFVPSLNNILTVLRRAVGLAASYIDEAIIAHVFIAEEENNWRAARDGLVLYGMTWKSVLGSTLLIVLAMYAVAFVMLLALAPLATVFGGLSPTYEVLGWVAVAGLALSIYLGVLRPWVKTVVITTFLIESRDLTPDNRTMEFIADSSPKFRELRERADSEVPGSRDDAPTESDVPAEGTT
ncbi:hypothetical protein [Natronorarus salvus]|uniref:hypothetical protein n=1 Tax=Natronorarus salvus TaxID=3117733 RepID=UPI002F266EC4